MSMKGKQSQKIIKTKTGEVLENVNDFKYSGSYLMLLIYLKILFNTRIGMSWSAGKIYNCRPHTLHVLHFIRTLGHFIYEF